MNQTILLDIIYLIGSVTFILGLKMMGKPDSARKGNTYAAFGMTLAILGTIFLHTGQIASIIYVLLFAAFAIGGIIGWMVAKKVKMTAMPQLGFPVQWYGWSLRCLNFYYGISCSCRRYEIYYDDYGRAYYR